MAQRKDRQNERVGLHRFEGPKGAVNACLFRARITLQADGEELLERALPDLDTAREEWNALVQRLRREGFKKVAARVPGRTRTVELESDRERMVLKVVGAQVFVEVTPPYPAPIPSPCYSLFSHESALAELDKLVANYVARKFRVVSDVCAEGGAVPSKTEKARKLDEPQVRVERRRGEQPIAFLDLSRDPGEWSSLADLIQEFADRRSMRAIRDVVLGADAELAEHSLEAAVDALFESKLADRLEGLSLYPVDSQGRRLHLGRVERAWRLPRLESLRVHCPDEDDGGSGETVLGRLVLPFVKKFSFEFSTDEHLQALLQMEAPQLRELSLEVSCMLSPPELDRLWSFLGTLHLASLEVEGPFVPQLVGRLDSAPWVAALDRLVLRSSEHLGEPVEWPRLEPLPRALASVPEVFLGEGWTEPLYEKKRSAKP